MSIVYRVRMAIYMIGIVAILIAIAIKTGKCETPKSPDAMNVPALWPPDMVPHPHVPTAPVNDGMA
jgi:hypothetical protein